MEYPIVVSIYYHISVLEIIRWSVQFCTGTDTKILTLFNLCLSFVWTQFQYNLSLIYASSHMKLTSNFNLLKTFENRLIQFIKHSWQKSNIYPHDKYMQARIGREDTAPTHSQHSSGRRWVEITTPRPLYSWERPVKHCTGDWVGFGVGLYWHGKSCLHRDSISGPPKVTYFIWYIFDVWQNGCWLTPRATSGKVAGPIPVGLLDFSSL
jgi:hypothetical protein